MSPSVSPELARSLDSLNRQIRAAEDALSRIPGAELAKVEITDPESRWRELGFGNQQLGPAVGIQIREGAEWRPLLSEPAVVRIAMAELIPQLIDAAVAAQDSAAQQADHIAEAIEARLAELESEWPSR